MATKATVNMRIPAELRAWLDEQAEKERRSLSNYVVLLIERAKEQADKEAAAGDKPAS